MKEFVIKNGFISKGDSIVSGSLSGETLNLTTTPSNDNSQTQVLVRNNTTGLVEYRDASTFSGASDTNTFVTGFTYNDNNTFTIFDNDGGSFPATINQVSGLTVNGTLSATTLDGGTILSGGTNLLTIIDDRDDFVTGVTWNNNGLLTTSLNNGTNIPTTIDTFSGITINNFIDFTQVTPSAPTPVAGRTFYSEGDNALSYHPDTPLMDVTINMGQEGVIRIYNNTGVQINNGQACHINGSFSGTPIVELSIASGITVISDTSFEVSGVATHDIPDSSYGFITTYGLVRDLNITGVAEGSPIWVSDTVPGGFIYSLPTTNASRITQIGYVITTGATDAKIMVQIENEQTVGILSAKEFEVISLNLSSTGLREGGLISADSSTTFKISAGSGIVMDTTTIPSSPVLTEVAWPDITGNTLTSLTGDVATVIMMNSNNTIQQYPLVSPPSQSDKRDRILLGVVAHSDKVSITNIYNGPIEILSPVNQIEDLTSSIGTFSINGNFISGISGTLELQKAIGDSFYYGGNYQTDKKNPSVLNTAVLSGSSTPSNPLVYATGTDVLGLSGYSINSDNYDPSGLGVITPLAPNKFTAHRIWHLPINNLLVFQYGQTEYNSLGVAIEGFSTENFVEPPGLNLGAYLISVIVTQEGETDLTNTTTTKFIQQGKFAGVGGGGGTIADTLQSAYSNSTSPEIVTDSTRGAVDYRIGTGTDSDNLVTFQQTGGVINAFITGEGNSSFNNISGDTLQLNTVVLNPTGTDILVRNSTTGVVDYRPVSGITPDLNTFVTGTTFGGNQATLTRNDGTEVLKLTGGTNVTLSNPSTNQIKLDVTIPAGMNTFVTGFTYDNNNTFTINDNVGSAYTATINQVSGLTVNGTLSSTTLDGSTILSGGTNLLTIIESLDTYVTGGTINLPATDDTNSASIGLLYKNSDGTPRTLPFEDTYTSGTTFASNQATLTRNDGTEVLKLTGGTNVTLSNPSSNQIKIDVAASSSIDTGNVLWVDNIFGNDGTALVDRQDKPWSSIATALSNSTTNDTIMVRPGEYVEPDFTLIPGTSLISQGGAKVTFISASTNTGNFITVSGSSYMEGFTLYTPTDDSAALYFNDPTGGIVTSFHNVHFKGSSVAGGPGVTLGKGLVMDSGLGSGPPPAKIIYTELRYGGGHLDTLVEVNKGIFSLDGMHVPAGQTINKGVQANGGRLQLTNVNIGNPNCDTALSVSGTSSNKPVVVGFGFNIFNVPTGIEITSDDYDVEVQGGRLEAGTTNVLVTSGLTGSNGKLDLTGFIMDSTKLSVPFTWVDSKHTFQYSDIGNSQNIAPILRTWSNFEVGHPNKGFETNLGRGSEYQNGLHVHTSGASSTSDYTLSAKTPGSTFTFESLTAGEQLYIGSSQFYPDGTQLNFNGFEALYTGSTGGTYTMEFYSGGTWVDIKYQCVHHNLGHNYSNNLFGRNVESKEDMRFGIDESDGWDSLNIAAFGSHTAKWIRITMVTPPASLPQFDLVWLEPSHTEVNDNGVLNFFGNALYKDTLVSAGNIYGESGGVVSGNVPVGSGGLPTGWDHNIKNSVLNQNGDAIYFQAALPKGICTAYPLDIVIYYGLDPGDSVGSITTSPQFITSFLARGASGTKVNDPSGGLVPTPRTIQNTPTLTSSPGSFVTSNLVETGLPINTYAGKPISIQDISFDIDDYYEGDGFLVRIELDDDGTPNQDVTIFAVEVDVVKWALGERIRIE